MERRMDRLVSDLCEENDCLKYELENAKADIEYWRQLYITQLNAEEKHHIKLMKGIFDKLTEVPDEDEQRCMHENCHMCGGRGTKTDGTPCVHMISCPCPKCTPMCYTNQ